MKKTLVAAGVVIALGIVWTGGAWYTGKKLENHLSEMVTQANEQLKRTAPEAGVELSYQNSSVACSVAICNWLSNRLPAQTLPG